MKRYSLIIIALLFGVLGFGQETPGYEVPNFAAKTPEAAAFLKYGEYPVDLSTGVPNISIPLYTIDLGDYKMPISLDYHASGIKVQQEATWVGLGWNLNFGAQVVLSVRDDVDENNPYIDEIPDDDAIIADWHLHPFAFNSGIMTSQNLDRSRVKDVYSFSSPTANGSFYIRDFATNDVVVFPPDASFKVKLTGGGRANMGFEITDSQGNQYLFTDTTEISARTMTHSDTYISSWYVDRIITATNKKIDFNYQEDGQVNDYSFSQRVEVQRIGYNACSNLETTQHQITPVINEGSTTMTAAKKIQEIIFNDGNNKVVFDKVDEREDVSAFLSYLKFMTVKHKENGVFVYKKGYEFLYSYFTNSGSGMKNKRLKLNNVIDMIDGSGHRFEYSSIPLPAKDSKGQDYFGYNNGAANIGGMIPRHIITNPYYAQIGGANRTVNPAVNQAGMLTEIHYPTKGWTKFNYETNQYYDIDKFAKYGPLENVSGTLTGTGPASRHSSTIPESYVDEFTDRCDNHPYEDNCIRYRVIPFTATNAVGSLTVDVRMDTGLQRHYEYARVRVFRDSDGYVMYDETFTGDNQDMRQFNGTLQSGFIVLEVYSDKFHIDTCHLQYYNTYPDTPQNLNGGGLRIGSIENYNFDNQLLLKKKYSYTDKSDASKSSGKFVNDLAVSFESNAFTNVSIKNLLREMTLCDAAVDYTSTYSISSNSRYGIEGNSVVYKYVREQQVDSNNEPNGYTDYEFTTEGDEIPFGNPTVQIYKSWKRGKVLVKEDYKISNGLPYLLRKETNNYYEDNAKISYINGFKFWRNCHINFSTNGNNADEYCPFGPLRGSCFVPNDVFEAYEVVTYNLPIPWYYLKSTNIEEHFYDASNTPINVITSNNTYNYNNPVHQQLTSQVTQSSKGEILETKYYYPQDAAMAAEPLMNALKDKNMIARPIVTETYRAGTKLSTQKTIFRDWGSSLLLPEFIQTAKGSNPLETRVAFTQYDQYGHPLELKRENGMVISYIWGYNKTEPIAKIENATNAQVAAALGMAVDVADESNLTTINNLRTTLPGAMVSTYTYIPLFGVNTITDPKGYTIHYEYDFLGRLVAVKDAQGKIVSENEYNYSNQN